MDRQGPIGKIGVWGHYHGANQGDECVVAALIQNIRRRCPEAEIFGFSQKPSDTRARHGIPSFPIRRPEADGRGSLADGEWREARKTPAAGRREWLGSFKSVLRRSWPGLFSLLKAVRGGIRLAGLAMREPVRWWHGWRHLRGIDMLIVAGSGPVADDWDGPWSHPYSIFKWAMLTKLRGTKFVFLSVGAGPVTAPLTRRFLRWSLKGAFYRSFRDPTSAGVIEGIGVHGGNHVYPDLGFSLDLGHVAPGPETEWRRDGRLVVGLNAMAHEDPRYMPRGDCERYQTYLRKNADFAEWLLRQGHAIVPIYSDMEADPNVCDDLKALLMARGSLPREGQWVDGAIETFEAMVGRMARCDIVVAARYHCMVLPFLLGKPVLALAYHHKTWDLMRMMGQADFCLDIDRFEPGELIQRFTRLTEAREHALSIIGERIDVCRQELDWQYDHVLGLGTSQAARTRGWNGLDAQATARARPAVC